MNNNASSLFELQMFKPVHKVNVLFQTNTHVLLTIYCMRTLARYSRINYIDQCITQYVMHVYTMDTCPCNEFTSVWSMFEYNSICRHCINMNNNASSLFRFKLKQICTPLSFKTQTHLDTYSHRQ